MYNKSNQNINDYQEHLESKLFKRIKPNKQRPCFKSVKQQVTDVVHKYFDCSMSYYNLDILDEHVEIIKAMIDAYGSGNGNQNILYYLTLNELDEIFEEKFEDNYTNLHVETQRHLCIKMYTMIAHRKITIPFEEEEIRESSNEEECGICYECNPLSKILCGHQFCKNCIDNLGVNNFTTCPMCRTKLNECITYDGDEFIPLSKNQQNEIVEAVLQLIGPSKTFKTFVNIEYLVEKIAREFGFYTEHIFGEGCVL